MGISIEQIDELRKRTNCSYEEAKILLEKHNGDLVEAIVEFEKKNNPNYKTRYANEAVSLGTKIKQLIDKGFKTRFIIEKTGETLINIPVNLLIVAAVVFHWFLFAVLVISYILGCRFKICKAKGESIDINKIINGFGSKVKEATGDTRSQNSTNGAKMTDIVKNDDKNDDDNGYNEFTVE